MPAIVYILIGLGIIVLLLVIAAVSACMLSSRVSQAQERVERAQCSCLEFMGDSDCPVHGKQR